MLVACRLCGKKKRPGAGSLPEGRYTCRPCRSLSRGDSKELPPGWACVVCAQWVTRTRGPVGMYCKKHKHSRSGRHVICRTCSNKFVTTTGRIYCSDKCRPVREKKAPQSRLDWRLCLCGKWICKPGRKYCTEHCSKEAQAIRAGSRNKQCRQCAEPLGYFNPASLCVDCRDARARQRKKDQRRNPDYRSLNNHRQRARHYGVDYEPVKRSRVFERDGWKCGICQKRVDKRLKHPHPLSASLDHVVPMALGGGHTYLNTQCAHLQCNSKKSHFGAGDQLALIG